MRRITLKHGFAWIMAFIMVLSMVVVLPELSMQTEAATKKVTVKKVTSVNSLTDSKTIYLAQGKKATLKTTVTVTPNKSVNKKVTYKSSNKKIATVTGKGVVTGKKAGTAKITVASKKNSRKKATVTVKVVKGKVTNIKLNKSSDTLTVGDIVKLTAAVKISKGGKKNVVWTSSNTKVATVKSGTVKAIGEGTATITVKAADGSGKKATCNITVKDSASATTEQSTQVPQPSNPTPQPIDIAVESIFLDKSNLSLKEGESELLKVTVMPSNATSKTAIWKSANNKIATVENGIVKGVSEGTTIIIVTVGNKNASCIVTVIKNNSTTEETTTETKTTEEITTESKTTEEVTTETITTEEPIPSVIEVESISLNKDNISMEEGENVTLSATILPDNATDKTITWTSDNENIVTVKNGMVNAINKGTATVTATSGNKQAQCIITVNYSTKEVDRYSYEVIPLMAPFNSYFYIKTDNPDPDSFRFVDEDTKYANKGETGSVTPTDTVFSDVKYENSKTKRVNGGYIATGSATDGGELRLQMGKVTGTHSVYNITTGETTMEKDYEYMDTTVMVQVAELKNVVDYLISTYGNSSKSYFDNLSGIQSGFSSECLYSGAHVLGEQKKSTTAPYYGLSTSPHVDQAFYIQSPYYRADSKSMLISALYPMKYDSIGFPSVMMSVAKELDSTVTVKWSSSAHYLVDVTCNGETKSYGGQGTGGGQGVNANQIKYWYSFDGSNEDAYMKRNLKDVAAMIREYGAMEVPEEPTDQPELTWASVRQTVGKEGSYVKLTLITSIFGGSADGYTFMYDDGSTGEGSQGWGAVGHFTNAWYDGRYFNKWEYYYPGAKFEDTVKTESPSIIMKDVSIKLPDDGKTYYYNYNTMDKVSRYNTETGVWSGFMKYHYDSESQTWKADILNYIKYREGYNYKSIEDQNFIDACTITMDEALAMNPDANTDKEPENYYIYDRVTSPGTYHSAGN